MLNSYMIFELNQNSKTYSKKEIDNDIKVSLLYNKSKKTNEQSYVDKVYSLDVFLPFRELQKGGFIVKEREYFINGYAFIEFDPDVNYAPLLSCSHVTSIVRDDSDDLGENSYSLMSYNDINSIKDNMGDFFSHTFFVGQLVEVIDGDYANMPARIVSQDGDLFNLVIVSRSSQWKIQLPPSKLGYMEETLIYNDDDDQSDDDYDSSLSNTVEE